MVDHFRVERLLGRGGMGEVYLARDIRLGRKVALKLVRFETLGHEAALGRFLFEARVTAKFSHPNIVTVFDVGEHQGTPYVALEYIEGQNLRDRMDEERSSPREAMRYAHAIALALAEAHRHDVLHRDLKPENVLLGRDGRVRVVDFGLAKPLSHRDIELTEETIQMCLDEMEDESGEDEISVEGRIRELAGASPWESPAAQESALTRASKIVGTPGYMAPEALIKGDYYPVSDVWALGAIVYEMLAGEHPFWAPDVYSLCSKVCLEDAPSLEGTAGVSDVLAELVASCLDRDEGNRPTAEEVASNLQGLLREPRKLAESETSPFRGLLPFTEQHADLFFGRDDEIAAFVERLREVPVLPVVGPSGAGKSSFVRAGVIPRLREQGRWEVITLRPGAQPFDTLAVRLARRRESKQSAEVELTDESVADLSESPNRLALELGTLAEQKESRVLLFVDQLEELFTHGADEEVRRAFMEAVCTAADDSQGPVRVVFTVRDDFLGRVAETAAAREVLGFFTVLRSPDAAALEQTLTRPVTQIGYSYDDESLPRQMIESVGGEPASLPLLQFACMKLWENRDRGRRQLTRRAYEAMGGVEGALANQAEELLEGLTSPQVDLARQLFLRLVTPERTRKLVTRTRILEDLPADAEEVLDRLISGRAVVVRKGRRYEAGLELVHESLITKWRLLSRWVDESRDEVVFLTEVGQAAELWDRRGRPPEEAWRGKPLDDALTRAARCTAVPHLVREFLEVGRRRAARKRLRTRLVLASVFVGLALLAAVLSVLTIDAREARSREQRERERVEVQRAEAILSGAREAFERGDFVEARAGLRTSLETVDSVRARMLWHELREEPLRGEIILPEYAQDLSFSPDGRLLAAVGPGGPIFVIEVATMRLASVVREPEAHFMSVTFSRDGEHIVTGDLDGTVHVRRADGSKVSKLLGHEDIVSDVDFSPDGELLVTASEDNTIRFWDIETGRELAVLRGHKGAVTRTDFSPDGETLASSSGDKTVRLWRVSDGTELRVLKHGGWVRGVRFHPSGKLIASASADSDVTMWDVETGAKLKSFHDYRLPGRDVAFSGDGNLVFNAGNFGLIGVWDLESGDMIVILRGHQNFLHDLALSPDGRTLASTDYNPSVPHRDVAAAGRVKSRTPGHKNKVWAVRFSPDGKLLASTGFDNKVRLWDTESGALKRELVGHQDAILGARFSPSGKILASGSFDRTVRLWDVETGKTLNVLGGHTQVITDADFSPDGKLLATTSNDHSVRIWDVETGAPLKVLWGHPTGVNEVDFSPDGRKLVSVCDNACARLWDVRTGEQLAVYKGHDAPVYSARFNHDGTSFVTAGVDGRVQVWDVESGEGRVVDRCHKRGLHADFNPVGDRVAATCNDGTAFIVGLDGGEKIVLHGHDGRVSDVTFHPEGRWIATSSEDRSVRLWEVETGRPVWRCPVLLDHPPEISTHQGWRRFDGEGEPEATRWRSAIEERALTASQSLDGAQLCLASYDGRLEAWDLREDRLLFGDPLPDLVSVISTPQGCLSLDRSGGVKLTRWTGEGVELHERATAIAWDPGEVLVAVDEGGVVFDEAGEQLRSFSAGRGATAMAHVGPWIALGYRDGRIELTKVNERSPEPVDIEAPSTSSVVRLLQGPSSTLIAGFANGQLGIWELEMGTRLHRDQLNGPTVHLLVRDHRLYAATELGDTRVVDMSVLDRERCDLMHEVWENVPIIWESGRVVIRALPVEHECSSR